MGIRGEENLHGYSLPLSPSGVSSMIPPPPWHFAGDALWVTYRANPEAVAAFLPPELSLGPDPGAAAIGFYDWQWCGDAQDELHDPVRAQFKECLIVLDCRLGDRPVARVPYAWVDSAVPLVRGFVQGTPKMFGSVWLTRSFPVGRAGPRREPGARFTGVTSADGRRILSSSVTLSGAIGQPPPLSDRPPVHTRHFPAWEPGEAAMEELVLAATTDTEFAGIWQGQAELAFHDVRDPDLARLAPVETIAGYVFSYAETLTPGRRVRVDGQPAGSEVVSR
jgi:enduracididine biosynthesis enzyme MppR